MPTPVPAVRHDARAALCCMLGVVLGTALQLQQARLWPWWAYGAGLPMAALLLLACLRYRMRWPRVSLGLCWLGVCLIAAACTGLRAHGLDRQRLPDGLVGQDVRVQGVIISVPQPLERGWRWWLRVEQAQDQDGQAVRVPETVALQWYGPAPQPALQAGQRWAWTVRLKPVHGERNPHGPDWELWWWSQGIVATGYVRQQAGAPPQYLGATWQAPVQQWRGQWLARMQAAQGAQVAQGGQAQPATAAAAQHRAWGVVQALVTGAQSRISREDWALFRDTGTAHLMSISGLHITMFAWLAMAVMQRCCRLSRWCCDRWPAPVVGAWAGWCLAAVYAVFSGWGVPAQRTVWMLLVVVMLRTQARRWPWPVVWLLVLTAVVMLDPWALMQAGFWLSFVAVGVLLATQTPRAHAGQPRGLWAAIRHLWREQWAIGVALAPLTLMLFGQISLIGFIANLLAIPWVTLVMTPLAMLGAVWPVLWQLAAWAAMGLVQVLQWLAQWPWAVWYVPQAPWWVGAVALLACVAMAMPWPWQLRLLGLPWVLPLLWWQPRPPAPGVFDMWALDVGQGSAVLLRTQRHSLLFDAGPRWSAHSDAGVRTLVPFLRAQGVRLQGLMISHGDNDHAGGAAAVAMAHPQAQRWGAGAQPCVAGQSWVWDGVRFQVLHPPMPVLGREVGNADSCVLHVQDQQGRSALLTGDITAQEEALLLQRQPSLRADVVMMPHHGSSSSSSAAWVQALQARFAIAQAGFLNRYGHPAPPVVERWQRSGAQVVVTNGCGAAYWHSAQPEQLRCERQAKRRYWQATLVQP